MDLSFAAAPEAADGDWGEDENTEAPGDNKLLARCLRSRSRSPETAPKEQPVSPQLALTNGFSSGSDGAGLLPPKSKIHSNPRTRYFVMKSNNHKNLVSSVENDVWATQRHNEEKLNEALHTAPHVVLVFSVNVSGCFQGYAKMAGRVGASTKTDVFKGYGRAFDIRWLRLRDLEFAEVAHIENPWNDHQSVKISRDGQELPYEVGARLCEMADLRVFRGDPGGYVTDEREVETGGFDPLPTPARSALQTQPMHATAHSYGAGLATHAAGCPPVPSYGVQPPHHHSAHGAVATPSGAGGQPPMNPWGLPPGPWAPHLGHGAWSYPPWGPGFDCSSYYSDSYTSSSSADGEEAVPPQQLVHSSGAPLPAPAPAPQEAATVVAPAVAETPPTTSGTAPARSRKESSKKAKKDKDKRQHEASTNGHSMASDKVVAAEKSNKAKKSKKEKTKKEPKESGKTRSHGSKRKRASAETGQAAATDGEGCTNRRDRERRRSGEKKSDASKPHRSSQDRTRRRDGTSKAPETSTQSQWRVGAAAVGHPVQAAQQPHAYGAPPPGWTGYGHPPQHQPFSSGVNRLPPLGHAAPPRAPPSDWHGACPLRR